MFLSPFLKSINIFFKCMCVFVIYIVIEFLKLKGSLMVKYIFTVEEHCGLMWKSEVTYSRVSYMYLPRVMILRQN